MNSYKVAIIGAGPIGLYTAIQIKLLNQKKNIIMFEKYKIYQRNHTVQINQYSFGNATNDPEFREILKNFGTSVPTSEIENKFLNFAEKIGIDIEYKKIESIEEITDKYTNLEIIIDASGSHSVCRKLFQTDNCDVVLNNLNYLVDLKYEVIGPTRYLNAWTEVPKTILNVNHLVSESVSKLSKETNKTQVSLHIFVNESEYNVLKDFNSFKNPIVDLNSPYIGIDLYKTIKYWLDSRMKITNEVLNDKSFKLTTTNLSEYYATKVYTNLNGIDCYLVGDAAFGVPYFRNINNGFLSANVLAKVCSKFVMKLSFIPLTNRDYSNYIYALQTKEKLVAHAKNKSIEISNSLIHSSQRSIKMIGKVSDSSNYVAKSIIHNSPDLSSTLKNVNEKSFKLTNMFKSTSCSPSIENSSDDSYDKKPLKLTNKTNSNDSYDKKSLELTNTLKSSSYNSQTDNSDDSNDEITTSTECNCFIL